jgi:hypothetical protein
LVPALSESGVLPSGVTFHANGIGTNAQQTFVWTIDGTSSSVQEMLELTVL